MCENYQLLLVNVDNFTTEALRLLLLRIAVIICSCLSLLSLIYNERTAKLISMFVLQLIIRQQKLSIFRMLRVSFSSTKHFVKNVIGIGLCLLGALTNVATFLGVLTLINLSGS
jgi:hypothetical protein